jgi:hypothetical protein
MIQVRSAVKVLPPGWDFYTGYAGELKKGICQTVVSEPLVTALEERALRSEGNGPVPGSGRQTDFVEECVEKLRSRTQAPNTALKLFISVPSLL